jgi:hypothetical protein
MDVLQNLTFRSSAREALWCPLAVHNLMDELLHADLPVGNNPILSWHFAQVQFG